MQASLFVTPVAQPVLPELGTPAVQVPHCALTPPPENWPSGHGWHDPEMTPWPAGQLRTARLGRMILEL